MCALTRVSYEVLLELQVGYDKFGAGQNATIADIEDAIVMNKSSLHWGFGRCMVINKYGFPLCLKVTFLSCEWPSSIYFLGAGIQYSSVAWDCLGFFYLQSLCIILDGQWQCSYAFHAFFFLHTTHIATRSSWIGCCNVFLVIGLDVF